MSLAQTLSIALSLVAQSADARSEQSADAPSETALSITLTKHTDRVSVAVGGEPFTEYRFAGDSKPYLYPLLAPGGLHVTRRWPVEEVAGEDRDHPHHRGSWFAHGAVNGHDFWTGEGGKSTIEVTEVTSAVDATVRVKQVWKHDGVAVLSESRVMHFSGTRDTRTIDFEITLSSSESDVVFGDTKEGTFAIRLAETLRLTGGRAKGKARNSEGIEGAAIWGKRARFVEYSGPLVENEETIDCSVALYDAKQNPRHPTWWHARDYGLFAANPFGNHDFEKKPAGEGDLVVKRGESVKFCYRLVIARGKPSLADLEGRAPPN